MVCYQCPRCHYETRLKGDIKRHYGRKTKCKTLFERKSIKDCIDELDLPGDDKIIISKKEYEELKSKKGAQNITNNVQINNTYNIINVNDFNSTNYKIALEDLKKSINNSLLKNDGMNLNIECENLVELVHCNDKYPENHNILLTDRNRGEVKVKQGDYFINIPIDDAIDETSQNIINLLKDNQLFNRYVKFHENKDDETVKEDKKAIERTLYNNRHKIQETVTQNGIKIK